MAVLEGLRKIECSKNYYSSPDGRVYSVKEIKPYKRGSKNYYQIQAENGSKIYYTIDVVKSTTETNEKIDVVKSTTEKVLAPKRKLIEAEITDMIF